MESPVLASHLATARPLRTRFRGTNCPLAHIRLGLILLSPSVILPNPSNSCPGLPALLCKSLLCASPGQKPSGGW